jgi:hypothetical protein
MRGGAGGLCAREGSRFASFVLRILASLHAANPGARPKSGQSVEPKREAAGTGAGVSVRRGNKVGSDAEEGHHTNAKAVAGFWNGVTETSGSERRGREVGGRRTHHRRRALEAVSRLSTASVSVLEYCLGSGIGGTAGARASTKEVRGLSVRRRGGRIGFHDA